MKRGLLNMQFWAGDRDQAMRVMRLAADMRTHHDSRYDVLLSARFDCGHDRHSVEHLARKFNVFTFVCPRQAVGWPDGCNNLWLGSMHHIHDMVASKQMPGYHWVLCLESDDVPLNRDWLEALHQEWKDIGLFVVGNVLPYPGPHVNGNCLMSGSMDFLGWLRKLKKVPAGGWDYSLSKQFQMWGWADTPLIRSIWGTETLSKQDIETYHQSGCRLLHGVKDASALEWARRNLIGGIKS